MTTEAKEIWAEFHTCNNGEPCLRCDEAEKRAEDLAEAMLQAKDAALDV